MWSCLWDFAGVWVEDGCIQPQLRVWNETLHSLCSSHGLIGSKSVYFFVPPYATCPLHRRRSGNMSTASAPAFVSQNAPHMQRILYHLESSCIVFYPCSDMFRMTEYSSLPIRLVVQSIKSRSRGSCPGQVETGASRFSSIDSCISWNCSWHFPKALWKPLALQAQVAYASFLMSWTDCLLDSRGKHGRQGLCT